ncbi:hypothetical protein O3P69_009550 [Scylla paramamosain]|uniref:Uncharacterized protein n=1 Tax=Scylla paramamosain TaxID=85552 RepID=A0AAW0SU44_SCYPA
MCVSVYAVFGTPRVDVKSECGHVNVHEYAVGCGRARARGQPVRNFSILGKTSGAFTGMDRHWLLLKRAAAPGLIPVDTSCVLRAGIREHSRKSQEHNTVSTKSTPPVAWTLVAGVLPSHGLHGPGAALSSSDGHCLSTPRLITIEDQCRVQATSRTGRAVGDDPRPAPRRAEPGLPCPAPCRAEPGVRRPAPHRQRLRSPAAANIMNDVMWRAVMGSVPCVTRPDLALPDPTRSCHSLPTPHHATLPDPPTPSHTPLACHYQSHPNLLVFLPHSTTPRREGGTTTITTSTSSSSSTNMPHRSALPPPARHSHSHTSRQPCTLKSRVPDPCLSALRYCSPTSPAPRLSSLNSATVTRPNSSALPQPRVPAPRQSAPTILQPHDTSFSSQEPLQGHNYTYEQSYILKASSSSPSSTVPCLNPKASRLSCTTPSQPRGQALHCHPSSVARSLVTADPMSRSPGSPQPAGQRGVGAEAW